MGVAKRSFSPSMMTGTYEKDFSDSEESSFLETERSGILDDGQSLDAEGLICLPGQIDIRSYMVPTKPVMDLADLADLAADEEAARAMGLDFGLDEDREDVEDVDMDEDLVESFSADEEAAVAMGLSSSLDCPAAMPAAAPAVPADTPARPKRKSQTLPSTPEKKIRVAEGQIHSALDKLDKLDKLDMLDVTKGPLADTVHCPAELGEVL
mmetsp:Transcript_79401/g.97132  ORF Transcript_79401/g.97132 Transcript_79401/m.97132 type:complete len:210 (+) Transcript_79401:54-683(+)